MASQHENDDEYESSEDTITADFAAFPCPNCQADYGKGRGMTKPGIYACALPSCKVCYGGKCYICYNCNKITRGLCYGNNIIQCETCKLQMKCSQHVWNQEKGHLSCDNCGETRQLQEKSCNKHNWTSLNGVCWSCSYCGKKAT